MDEDHDELIKKYRYFLKDSIRKTIDFSKTDQSKGILAPPLEKSHNSGVAVIDLPLLDWEEYYDLNLVHAIRNRKSHRMYSEKSISLNELSLLLWATQGIRFVAGHNAFRNVPSAGCRHALETYLAVMNVEDLETGIYRYLPLSHQLILQDDLKIVENRLRHQITKGTFDQKFAGESSVTFIWTAIPYRMEWRYDMAAHKVIAIDAGHVAQNLYLACELIGSGMCALAAYDQEYLDELLKVDGEEEFVIYLASVGKL